MDHGSRLGCCSLTVHWSKRWSWFARGGGRDPQKTKPGRLKYTQARWEHPGDPPVWGQVLHCVLKQTLLDHVQSFDGRFQEWVWASLMVYDTSLAPSYISEVEPVMPHQTFPGESSMGKFYNWELCKGRQLTLLKSHIAGYASYASKSSFQPPDGDSSPPSVLCRPAMIQKLTSSLKGCKPSLSEASWCLLKWANVLSN